MSAGKSVILITVDCLRGDHVGFNGYAKPTTPFLDSLAAEGFVFPAAIVAGAPTYYSFPAILAGRAPLALGRDLLGVAPGEPTLATEFSHAGYATAAMSAANPYLSGRFGYAQGFDSFADCLDDGGEISSTSQNQVASADSWSSRLNRWMQKASRGFPPAARVYDEVYFRYCQRNLPEAGSLDRLRRFPAADQIVDRARSWLDSIGQRPFFLWLHFMDPHAPYYPKREALQLMGEEVTPARARYLNSLWQRDISRRRLEGHKKEMIALYDAGIRWVDAQVQRLAASLEATGVWKNCVLAFTGDHGEEFLDHGGRFHPPQRLMEELIRVPLLLRVPGSEKRKLTPSPFSLVDLAPTLMNAAESGTDHSFGGHDRWPQIAQGVGWDEPAIVECASGCTNPFHRGGRLEPRVLAVREARYKLVLDFARKNESLYDLEADPGERSPLPPSALPAVRRRLLERARDHVTGSRQRDADLRLRAQLADLRLEWANSMTASSTAGF